MRVFCLSSAALLCLTLPFATLAAPASSTLDCTVLSIDDAGFHRVQALQADLGLWLELDQSVFACDRADVLSRARAQFAPGTYWPDVPTDRLLIARASHPGQGQSFAGAQVLTRGGPYQVLLAESPEAAEALLHSSHSNDAHGCQRSLILPLTESRVLVRQSSNTEPRDNLGFGQAAQDAAEAVDRDRWMADVTTLAGWNRYTHGSQIAQARDWLVAQMNALGLDTTTEAFQVGGTTAHNVIGRLDGTTRPDDWFLVGAHYDATSQNASQAAPGAEDNASGCAGVLELARIVAPMEPEATVFFICYSGEEQGLHGSDDHAGDLVAAGHSSKVQRVLTMDMIGYTGDADLDVLLETEPPFADTLDALVDAAEQFTTLRTSTTLFAFGSDHVPYLDRDLPALLTIENDWDSYPSYHRTSDTPDNLTPEMGEQILRMNAAVLAQETGAQAGGAAAIFADGFEAGNTNAWSVSP